MQSLFQQIEDWLKQMLISGIMNNIGSIFSKVDQAVGDASNVLRQTPASFNPNVYIMVRDISENVIMPIAGIILTFVACYELIQLVISHNNLQHFETWIFFKWVLKTFIAVELITNTFDIFMAVFDVAQHVVVQSSQLIQGNMNIGDAGLMNLTQTLDSEGVMTLFSIYLHTFCAQYLVNILYTLIFVIAYGRMIEVYLLMSMAPIPMATLGNKEQSMVGQNYLRSVVALAFQAFLMMICITTLQLV